jgi:hypothetical protein
MRLPDTLLRIASGEESPFRAQLLGEDTTWRELHRAPLERLVGCLSTPLPKPTD